jgi:formiminotetrahydrofolate cyclodeaminase
VTSDATSRPAGDQTIGQWLDALGSAAPAPGGGAAAAMSACLGAALVEMVCRLTTGKAAFAEHEPLITAIGDAARQLGLDALSQIDEDTAAFTALMASYRLPKDTGGQQAARQGAIRQAIHRAAVVPLGVAATAAEVIRLAAQLPGRSNPNVLSDVAVAASTAAAAIDAAAVNVDVNLVSLTDPDLKAALAAQLAGYVAVAAEGRQLATEIRERIIG